MEDILLIMFLIIISICLIKILYDKMPKVEKKCAKNNSCDYLKNEINSVRTILKRNSVGFVDTLNDEELNSIWNAVVAKFNKASKERKETISYNQKIKILAEIISVANISGWEFAIKHLDYEVNRYLSYGLRKDNKGLF
ncbi:hypothetical protein [Campylobacter geochelonis]|uniref:Uncharacterized protein n=1 Tax=Campylobacter geochelonis TaxID=1780362 RepID=A0A128EMY9_9BACT|nr:hypothetical protein [Campylobacter geochelonis]QKF71075.1 hypothetical protein CGEO_0755 [Campylobacter geochelonis]CZE47261.1 Uncharacterised protein [Campylobacter geochelonis]CZE48420.1 Uncharacterised protein [Campylobacter geochelonis]CZE50109.1 Uncharacterised protein [Campylobacter geochelonis]